MGEERYERGRRRMVEVHGERSLETVESLGDLGRMVIETAYGDVYDRPGLSLRDRQLVTVGVLTALGRSSQLPQHLRTSLRHGVTEAELADLGRIVSAYLDLAESRAKRRVPMTMEDWAKRLDIFLSADEREVLQDAGRISAEIAKAHAVGEFEKYRVIQDKLFQSDFDTFAALEQREEDKGDE